MPIKIKATFKRIWHDPVWSAVIAAIIIAILGVLFYLFRKTILPFLGESIHIQLWLFIILCILSILQCVRITRHIKNKLFPSNNIINKLEGFEEKIDNLIWKGQYKTSTCEVERLSSFCPDCDLQVVSPRPVYNDFEDLTGNEYVCEHCNKRLFYYIEGIDHNTYVKREIERRLRKKVNHKRVT